MNDECLITKECPAFAQLRRARPNPNDENISGDFHPGIAMKTQSCTSVSDASDDAGKFAHLILFEVEIRRRPFLRQLDALLLNCRRRDFESRRKRHSQKFENPSGSITVGSDNILIKENERINLVFMKVICPAYFASHDTVIQVINDVEIKAWDGTHLGLLACFLRPNTCLQCYSPGDCLLDAVPAAHPNVFRPVENGSEE